jgi:hypothetical protein
MSMQLLTIRESLVMKVRSGLIPVAVFAYGVFCLMSCAHLLQKDIPPEEALRMRVAGYWQALLDSDLEAAFLFIEPKGRTKQSHNRFVAGMSNFIFLSYEIEDIELAGDCAYARVKRTMRIQPGFIPIDIPSVSQTIREKWVLIDGVWYAAYESPQSPFGQDTKGSVPVLPGSQSR